MGNGQAGWVRPAVAFGISVVMVTAGGSAEANEVSRTTLVSADSAGVAGNQTSRPEAASPDGRFVVFTSRADNLVPGDTNQSEEVFLRDRRTGTTHRVAVSTGGIEAGHSSGRGVVNDDGRLVAFQSSATNLVAGDTDQFYDIFVRDRRAGTTVRASVGRRGGPADNHSSGPSISGDGRYLMFSSEATNLVASDTNGVSDVFVRDLRTGRTTRVSVRPDGTQVDGRSLGSAISGNGRFVLFESLASDLVPGDANGASDIFVKDLRSGRVELVSRTPSGGQFTGQAPFTKSAISVDGTRVVFDVSIQDPPPWWYKTQVYLRDRVKGLTTLISAGQDGQPSTDGAQAGTISGNGRYLAFETWSSDVPPAVPPSTRIVVRDLTTGRNMVASRDSQGRPIRYASHWAVATNDGVVFFSAVADIVPGVPIRGPMPVPPPLPPPPPGAPPFPLPPRPDPGLMATAGHVYFRQF